MPISDRRRSARYSLMEHAVQGLTEILTHRTDLDDTVWLTNIDNLSVLSAGIELDTPAELLAGEGFGQLIREGDGKIRSRGG